jgi:hypothetical protein
MENEEAVVPESTTLKQVILEFIFLCAAAAFVAFFAQNTPLMSALIGVNIVARFILIRRKHDWVFFLIGFVLGGGNDLVSMLTKVYMYTPDALLPIPFWMLVLWGQIFVAFRQLFQLQVFQGPPVKGNPWRPDYRLIVDIATFIALRVIIYNFVRQEPVPTIAFAAVVILRIIILPPKKRDWLLIAVVVVLGLSYEAALIAFGLYVYYDPVFLGMPAWLMIYWAFMIPIFAKGIFDRIEMTLAAGDAARNGPLRTEEERNGREKNASADTG